MSNYIVLKQLYFSLRNSEDYRMQGCWKEEQKKAIIDEMYNLEKKIYAELDPNQAQKLFMQVNKMLDPHKNLKGSERMGAQVDENGKPLARGKYFYPGVKC